MPSPDDPALCQMLRLPVITPDPISNPRPLSHACLGPRLFNGYIKNNVVDTDEELWACLPECERTTQVDLAPQPAISARPDSVMPFFSISATY